MTLLSRFLFCEQLINYIFDQRVERLVAMHDDIKKTTIEESAFHTQAHEHIFEGILCLPLRRTIIL